MISSYFYLFLFRQLLANCFCIANLVWFTVYVPIAVQAVPLSARKPTGGSSEGIAPFLQLPHFSESVIKKMARKVRE